MKKIFTLLVAGLVGTAAATAQKAMEHSRFFDNWSIGLVGGGITPTTHSAFWSNMRPSYGLEITKQITPGFGLAVQGTMAHNITDSRLAVDAHNISLLGKVNLFNLFGGYSGEPRVFEMEAVVGAGWGREYYKASVQRDYNFFTTKYGVNFNFNVGEKKAWTISVKPSIVYNMQADRADSYIAYDVNKSAIELMAGVTYHFKNWTGKHYFTKVRTYDQAEVDGLNAKINDLRDAVSDKEGQLAKANNAIGELQRQLAAANQSLAECMNRKPVTEYVTKNTHSSSMEQTVTFRQGKYTVDPAQLPNVERVATFLKNHPEATVSIKGYASPEGSAEINAKIAKARAEAVKKILVEKYKIAAERISAEGQGVGNMFSEPDWNRVSICTLEENKE